MAYSELDREYIRKFLGYSAIFLQGDPRLENAITATQSLADGGSRPDSTTENDVKGLIYGTAAVTGAPITPGGASQAGPHAIPARVGLLTIKNALDGIIPAAIALKVDEIDIDPARGASILRRNGRELVKELSMILSTPPRSDVFGVADPSDDPYADSAIGLGAHNGGGTSFWP